MTLEHALNIDFVDESQGLGARVAVELTPQSARKLVDSDQRRTRPRRGCRPYRVRVTDRPFNLAQTVPERPIVSHDWEI